MLVLFSLQSSLQSSVHPEYSLIYISLRPVYSVQSSTHLEHSWTYLVYSPHAQLVIAGAHLETSGTQLDTSGHI